MVKFYCLPMTAATDKLHIGNLYSWILADSYRTASKVLGTDFQIRATWNCISERLEKHVYSTSNRLSQQEVRETCMRIVNNNIERANGTLLRYDISFFLPAIRDDSPDYKEVVLRHYEKGVKDGKISNFFLQLPCYDEISRRASAINFYAPNLANSLGGIPTLKAVKSIHLLRKGVYGIPVEGAEGMVLGQRYVQSLLPEFYKFHLNTPDIFICGKDVLAKWVYFMIANSNTKPFNNIGLHGLVLKKGGGKISKYENDVPLIDDITSHPDNVRLSLLKRPFGIDFNFPNFESEEKFRRKIENCLNFLLHHAKINEGTETDDLVTKIKELERSIAVKLLELNPSGSYNDFKSLTYNHISSAVIPLIKNRGISQNGLNSIASCFIQISEIFAPVTTKKYDEATNRHLNINS